MNTSNKLLNSEAFRDIVQNRNYSTAFIIGNGINRLAGNNKISWDNVLLDLWHKYVDKTLIEFPDGITYPEIFDILTINHFDSHKSFYALQKELSSQMTKLTPTKYHTNLVTKIKSLNSPIITTNFDLNLSNSLCLPLKRLNFPFTRYYPWGIYFSDNNLDLPTKGFGIWHMHGLIDYPDSIRFGLTHYANAIRKTSELIHKGENRLFGGKDVSNWEGRNTWLHIWFNMDIIILGLALEENESFLRWLLIERARYFKKYKIRQKKAWYVIDRKSIEKNSGKILFLKNVGVEVLVVKNRENIYEYINDLP